MSCKQIVYFYDAMVTPFKIANKISNLSCQQIINFYDVLETSFKLAKGSFGICWLQVVK